MASTSLPNADPELVVATAADDGYAIPLAVTIRSALDHLDPNRRLRLFVLDGGLSDATKSRLLKSWSDPRLSVEWVRPNLDRVRDLLTSEHVNAVTYLRLLLPETLPATVARVIYLDADLLVRRDLANLWDEPQAGYAVLAAGDVAAPFLDARLALPTFERCSYHLAAHTPIANYRELGLPPDAPYFNGGVLVVDLAQWRRERLGEQMIECLRQHRRHVQWWDQYALNVVLAGKWRALDPRWNQGAHIYVYPNWRSSPFDRETFVRLQAEPWIVHFCSPSKPWHYFCRHPMTRDFRRCLARTEWQNWRPVRPENYLRLWWDFRYQALRKQWKTNVRAAKQVIRRRRRPAA